MKIIAIFVGLLCLAIGALGFYSIFTHEELTLDQTQFYEGMVSEINSLKGTTKYIFENDSLNIYIITYRTNYEINHSKVDIHEVGQNYKVHYINYDYDEKNDKLPYKKEVVTLSKNGQEALSLKQYNEGKKSSAMWAGVLGAVFFIFGLFSILQFSSKNKYIQRRRKKLFKKLEKLPNYENQVIIISNYKVKVEHEITILASKYGNYERMVIFIPMLNDISTQMEGKVISKFETKVIEGVRYIIHFYPITTGLTISKFEKWINKNVDELDNFIQKK